MRQVRFYQTEQAAKAVEPLLAAACGIREIYLYKCRDHDMFMASDEDTGNFLRHRHTGKMFNAVYWDVLAVEQPEPRVYPDMARLYSTEQQLLQRRLVPGSLHAIQSHVYQAHVEDGLMLFAFDVYQGQCVPVVVNEEQIVATYRTTYGQSKLVG